MTDAYFFLQFAGPVAAHDTRGLEELSDRCEVGRPMTSHGSPVASIALAGDWFTVRLQDGRTYQVPVGNVRSARAIPWPAP